MATAISLAVVLDAVSLSPLTLFDFTTKCGKIYVRGDVWVAGGTYRPSWIAYFSVCDPRGERLGGRQRVEETERQRNGWETGGGGKCDGKKAAGFWASMAHHNVSFRWSDRELRSFEVQEWIYGGAWKLAADPAPSGGIHSCTFEPHNSPARGWMSGIFGALWNNLRIPLELVSFFLCLCLALERRSAVQNSVLLMCKASESTSASRLILL